jgi:two-component system, cell cycle response regulator DivK
MQTILLVEDNELNQDMLRRWLQHWGFQVLVADDGVAGLTLARTAHPDLIVMDINLPVMDGLEATTRLKAAPSTRGIPILVLTAHASIDDRRRSEAAGADEYETKPVDFARLRQKILALLAARVAPDADCIQDVESSGTNRGLNPG